MADKQYNKVTLTYTDGTTEEFDINTIEEAKSGELEAVKGFVLALSTRDAEGVNLHSVVQTVNANCMYSTVGAMCAKIIDIQGVDSFLGEGLDVIVECIKLSSPEFKKTFDNFGAAFGITDVEKTRR